MRNSRFKRSLAMGLTTISAFAGLVRAMPDDSGTELPNSVGTIEKGALTTPLYRGAAVPDELLVIDTPGNCQNHMNVEIEWDKENNHVQVHLTGKNVLAPNPTILRTEGVDYFPNDFWPEAKDIVGGRYLLWLITPVDLITLYYDSQTLDLLGSEYDFNEPPEAAIPVLVPALIAVSTNYIDVQPNGDVDFTHVFQYDALVRGDLPEYTHHIGSFIPHTLCKAHPTDYTQTTTRPYTTSPQPATEAKPFSEYLRNGLILDITVEPQEHVVFPPVPSNVATYSQALPVAGGIPRGWTLDLEAVFANLAPPIRPWEAAGTCERWFKPVRTRNFDICAMPEMATTEP